ncbi:hypothetical protein [Helicobacter typhlonius]|uniref:Uncharacterized protein n=2 Tax=Helicobacter typhlonius TaxID=76936 RepID=A0A0S4PWV2_9HELI|nr:hypothetical protein [Helicobacter typhlonius]CUU40709.1 Hypothetical protein BN2458_PEG1826 [Helicobacter typhlonius]
MRGFIQFFRFYDYKGGVASKRLGFRIIKKDNVATLLIAGFPLLQKKVLITQTGGGYSVSAEIIDVIYRFCGFPVFKTFKYKKLNNKTPYLRQNYLLSLGLCKMSDSELFEKTQNLCKNMDSKSKQIVHRIISRTKEADLSPTNKVFCLTQDEREKLEYIHNDYRANICKVTSNIFCLSGLFSSYKAF